MRKRLLILLFIFIFPTICLAADTQVTNMTEMTDVQGSDIIYIVDDPAGVPADRKITITNVFDAIDTSAELSTILTDETGSGAACFGTSPTIATPTLTLQDGNAAAPTTDGQVKFDRTTERLQVGDGAATNEFYTGAHTTDTSANTVCAGTTTYMDGEGGCDNLDGVEDFETATDDSVIVGNGTTFDTKTIADCDDGSGHLNYDTTTNAFSCGTTDADTQLTQEQVEDYAGALVTDGTGTHTRIAITYQDASGDIDFVVDDMNDDIPEAGDYTNLTCTSGVECTAVTGTINVDLVTAGADADSATTSSDSGLEFVGSKLTVLRGCADNEILKWDEVADNWNCEADSAGGGSAIIFDIGDDGGNDSVDVNEIATTGDTNAIFTEPTADKILIAVGNNWPTADTATTASALAANPTDCAANQFANTIAANGNLTCAAIADADVPDTITIDLAATATALAANGANCSAGNYPLGVDASGAAESCTADDDVPDAGEVAAGAYAADSIDDDDIDNTTPADVMISAVGITIDGGGSAITTGIKGYIEVPFNATITQATMLADQSGSIVIDVWKDTYANYPPTDADSITAAAVPTITTATKSQDSTLTGWTTTVTAGDILGFNVDSITTLTRVHLILKLVKN